MSAHVYLITEGVHDVFFLGKIFRKAFALDKLEEHSKLDEIWNHILPSWPYKNSLRPSVPAPTFYGNASFSVALVNADGIDNIKTRLHNHSSVFTREGVILDAVGVVLDADFEHAKQMTPAQRFDQMSDVLTSCNLPCPSALEVVGGTPRTGIYILPGGGAHGTLEDILLECAAIVYPTLGCRAVRFIDGLDLDAPEFTSRDLKDLRGLSGRNKAVLGAMGAVLKPGKPIQASIEDHHWIEPRTLALPRVAAIVQFLGELLGAPPGGVTAQGAATG